MMWVVYFLGGYLLGHAIGRLIRHYLSRWKIVTIRHRHNGVVVKSKKIIVKKGDL